MIKKALRRVLINLFIMTVVVVFSDVFLGFTSIGNVKNIFSFPDYYFISDSDLGVVQAANFKRSVFSFRGPGHEIFNNELGCFDSSAGIQKNTPYILIIGDSFTWGYAKFDDKWGWHLEKILGIRVLKCGVPGTGSRYQLEWLKRLFKKLPHPPKLVIQLYDETDFNDDVVYPGYTSVKGQRVSSFKYIDLVAGERDLYNVRELEKLVTAKKIRSTDF